MSLDGDLIAESVAEGISFVFTVTNPDDEPVELTFSDGQQAEFVVRDDGDEVWRWSDDRLFVQMVQRETLAPGESTTIEATWPTPPQGRYTAEATLEADETALAVQTTFDVACRAS